MLCGIGFMFLLVGAIAGIAHCITRVVGLGRARGRAHSVRARNFVRHHRAHSSEEADVPRHGDGTEERTENG